MYKFLRYPFEFSHYDQQERILLETRKDSGSYFPLNNSFLRSIKEEMFSILELMFDAQVLIPLFLLNHSILRSVKGEVSPFGGHLSICKNSGDSCIGLERVAQCCCLLSGEFRRYLLVWLF